ncbi:hypothetical protein LOTGIDRAFT_229085 [Lottia gigantea]|uniref:BTB domain-containing protein n=1 Tax=Lottia gigantea TaxID=225164 RepID=V3ZXQ4_LOTGI|nr:hypothetical protein LOTGIDRAFT_229085 [Lottia gigantea]ESO89187.1 hypothetical protein LOTGIDRAFT_229085 [Lottia gigantea]
MAESDLKSDKTAVETISDTSDFIQRFENLFDSSRLSDVVLCVSGERYRVHKFILVTASEVFCAMLSDQWQESKKTEIQLTEDDACKDVFEQFLKYLYTGSIDLAIDTTLPILLLADKYSIKTLQKSCVQYMQRHIVATPDTNRTLSWYQYAKLTSQEELMQECGKFILSNFSVILEASDWNTLSKNEVIEFLMSSDMIIESEYILWLYVEQWLLSTHNKDNIQENINEILPLIHFSMILPKHLLMIESSNLCQDFNNLFKEKLNQAYRHHSLAVDCAEVGKSIEPYRNYCSDIYKICHPFSLHEYKDCQRIDSKITIRCQIPPRFISPNHPNCDKDSAMFHVYFYPKGFFSIITLYGSYVGRRNDGTTLKVVNRMPYEVPIKIHITLVLYSLLNSVKYVSFTHNSHHLLTKQNNFEDTVDNVIDIKKLADDSQYLINGALEGKIFIKVEDMGEHLGPTPKRE